MKSKYMIGILSSVYIGYDLITALDHISDIGFQYVEIAAVDGALEHLKQGDITTENAKKIRKELDRRSLLPNAIAAHTSLSKEGGAQRFLPRIRFAAEIGCPVCVTACGREEDSSILFRNLDFLVKEAEALQVVVALETNADTILSGTGGQAFVERWKSPWLGVNYDAANIYRGCDGKVDILEDFQSTLNELKHVHIKDLMQEDEEWRFCQPGTGLIDTEGFLKILSTREKEIGVNLELPFQYRFDHLISPLRMAAKIPEIKEIDRIAENFREMATKALN